MTSTQTQTISIITATLNAASQLPGLIDNLRAQTDKDFQWVVVDGGSTDGTIELLAGITDLNLTYISEKDHGIFDALNKAVRLLATDYYITVGADDRLFPEAVALYRQHIGTPPAELITGSIYYGSKLCQPGTRYTARKNIWSLLTCHSVGLMIRRDLHGRYGMYNHHYTTCADMAFLLKAYRDGVHIARFMEPVGMFSTSGISNTQRLRTIFESTLVRVADNKQPLREIAFMLYRIARHYRQIKDNLGNRPAG